MTCFQDAPDKAMEDDKAMEVCSINNKQTIVTSHLTKQEA